MASDRVIICVHGAGPKPAQAELLGFWQAALRQGVQRDHGKLLAQFDATPVEMVYYASALQHLHPNYDLALDLLQRQQVLDRLAKISKARDFRRRYYEELPGKTPVKEFLMDVAASIGLARWVWPRLMPELGSYWASQAEAQPDDWAAAARRELGDKLHTHLQAGRQVCLISHCLGSVLAYDVLQSLQSEQRVGMWLTLGSPLASNAVLSRLQGRDAQGAARFPTSLVEWHNLAAEDDYVCHDKTVRNDFSAMLDDRLIGDITDHTIYNLAVRYGRSNPHHSTGYLVHPRTIAFVAEWLGRKPKA